MVKEIKFTKEDVDSSRHQGYKVFGTLKGYCELHDGCSCCNSKIRFLCKIKVFIESMQTKIVNKICR